ncbi:MAG TPA: hypothetical protein VEO91_05870 [Candidatus Limnocylindria bacterium]|nr:hypothetical protein [Candidatus Limnocylindria bacterium]
MKDMQLRRLSRRLVIRVVACALGLMSVGTAVAIDRLPVSSRDDELAALANRISAVANVAAMMDGRLMRIETSTSPSPIVPPSPIYPGLVSVQDAAAALLVSSSGIVCASQGALAAAGGETISDDDARAEDVSSDGLVKQLDAVATVLGQANARLTRIADLVGQSPGPDEVEAAGAVWAESATIFNRTADLLANADHVPPSPVCPAG